MQKKKTQKTYNFSWLGKDRTGKKQKGIISSESVALVKAQLRKNGINPIKVSKQISFGSSDKGGKIKPVDIAIFTRQLATMMKAGVPLLSAFDITAEGIEKTALKRLIQAVKNDVASGNTLAKSVSKHPLYFDELYCSLIDAGEQSGSLETLLERIASYKEKTEALKAQIKKAMNYPIGVVCIAFIVSGLLLVKVVPQFEEVFEGFGAELPAFTKLVVSLSEAMQEWWYVIIMAIAGFIFFMKHALKKSKKLQDKKDRLLLKLPIIGEILTKSAIARFCRTLSTTFSAGIPLIDALKSVSGAAGNVVFREATESITHDVSSGQQLQFSMKKTGVFPSLCIQMVAIGEESGALDEMLDKVATFFEDDVDNMIGGLTSLMEPMIMAVLGILVGGLIIAMYLPIFKLGSAI